MRLTNLQISEKIKSLEPILPQRNKIGYVAARNYRILSNSLVEYEKFKMELLEKYGEPEITESGINSHVIKLSVDSPNFIQFCKEMEPYNKIEQDVDIMVTSYQDVIGVLTGEEIISIDWMLQE